MIIDEKYGSLLVNVSGEVIDEGLITLSLEEVLIGFTQNINYNPDNSIVLQKPRITNNDILEWIIVKLEIPDTFEYGGERFIRAGVGEETHIEKSQPHQSILFICLKAQNE